MLCEGVIPASEPDSLLFCREDNLNVASAHIKEVRTEQVFFVPIANAHLSHRDKIFVFTDIIRQAFVSKRVNFTRNDKIICPHFY